MHKHEYININNKDGVLEFVRLFSCEKVNADFNETF